MAPENVLHIQTRRQRYLYTHMQFTYCGYGWHQMMCVWKHQTNPVGWAVSLNVLHEWCQTVGIIPTVGWEKSWCSECKNGCFSCLWRSSDLVWGISVHLLAPQSLTSLRKQERTQLKICWHCFRIQPRFCHVKCKSKCIKIDCFAVFMH